MKCMREGCNGELVELKPAPYPYEESGLRDVTLIGVKVRRCDTCRDEEVTIPRMKDLHRAIARALAVKTSLLTGGEIRFLRKHLGLSGVDFAAKLRVAPETVSRWERDHQEMGWSYEILLRFAVLVGLRELDYDLKAFDAVEQKREPAKVRVISEERSWRPEGGMLIAPC